MIITPSSSQRTQCVLELPEYCCVSILSANGVVLLRTMNETAIEHLRYNVL